MLRVNLGESFPTSTYLQKLASIQPRTSRVKFARSPRTDVFDLAGLVIVRLAFPFVLHFVNFLESFGQSMDSWSSLVARENRCIFEYV